MPAVQSDTAWVLHQRAYRDSSRIVELLTQNHGRLAVVAKGVKGAKQQHKAAALQPFSCVWLEWSGRSELKTLRTVEQRGSLLQMQGDCLYAGFYLNELILRLLRQGDSNEEIFPIYSDAIMALAKYPEALPVTLRIFEKRLLDGLGYGLQLSQDVLEAKPVEAEAVYQLHLQYGPQRCNQFEEPTKLRIKGQTLLALAAENLTAKQAQEIAPLMRLALAQYLGEKPLQSRELIKASRRFS